MNPRNIASFIGIIPDTDKIKFEFKENSEEAKNCFRGNLSVRRNYKKADEQYYPTDLIPFTAFGKTASFINQYINRGDTVCVSGAIQISDNYTNKEGITVYGSPYLYVESISKIGGEKNFEDNSKSSKANNVTTKSNNPLLNRRRSVI